jgi:hypothetical protein
MQVPNASLTPGVLQDKHSNQINVCVTIQKRKLNTKKRKLNVIEKKRKQN